MSEKTEMQAVRGTRDVASSEKLARDELVALLKKTFERYGFNPLETPAFENWSVLSAKSAGGEEILKEAYKLTDQGGRALGLRYDLTVPLCRFVADNSRLALPFKRYQIASVWRDGPVSSQRWREFLQCDADVVGAAGMIADAECLALANDFFSALGMPFVIKINNRKFLNGVLETAGVPVEKRVGALLSVDKLEKIGREKVVEELEKERGLEKSAARELLGVLDSLSGSSSKEFFEKAGKILADKSGEGSEGLRELRELVRFLDEFGVSEENFSLDASLARGLTYYTGTVFEVVLPGSRVTASVSGGGRYDDLIKAFLGGDRGIPAVGISFGIDRILEALEAAGKPSGRKTVTSVFVIPIGEKALKAALKAVRELRDGGVNCDVDLMQRGVSRNLEYAAKQGARFAAIIGEREAGEGVLTLRDLESGKEEKLSATEALKRLR
ncbi:histidine--tRNA ligase [Candidatus Micrarchaeota archaeon]|nr:histidine--tRNA ligase [Candidatus Micrarchaeota archaeon]